MSGPLDGNRLPSIRGPLPGPVATTLCDQLADVEFPALTMRRARRRETSGASHDPIVWRTARGANVSDVDGNVYVDLTAGFGAALVGHGEPSVVRAVQQQAATMMHALGDVHPSEAKIHLEARLAASAPWPDARVILGLSGSDAMDAALKTAWLATRRTRVIAFEGAYHGLALAPGQLCGYKHEFSAPFASATRLDIEFAGYPARADVSSNEHAARLAQRLAQGDVAAVVIEPVLGRGGVCDANVAAIDVIVQAARAHGTVVIADEILSGSHRASRGALAHCASSWTELPDIVALGKALGGGLPISACVMRPEVATAWGAPDHEALHTSTFLGNPLSCAAALACLDVLESDGFARAWDHAVHGWWDETLRPMSHDASLGVARIDGAGLLLGIHLVGGAARALRVMRALLEAGFIVLTSGRRGDCISLTPTVDVTGAQRDAFRTALTHALQTCEVTREEHR